MQKIKDIESISLLLKDYPLERLSKLAELFFMIPEDKVGMFKSGRRTPAMMVHLAPRLSRDLAQAENTKEGL